MNDAAFTRGHGLEAKRLTRLANALGGHLRGEPQFGDARGAKVAAIEAHSIVELRIEPQPAHGDMLKSLEQISVALEQQGLIRPVKVDHNLGCFQIFVP